MKIFVLGVPHTITSPEFSTCAFTMKAFNLCRMMYRTGNHVIHLGVEGSNPECTEHVNVASMAEWKEFYGHPGRDYYNLETGGKFAPYHKRWAKRAKLAILERCDDDYEAIMCMTWGGTQRTAIDGIRQFEVESGIGYPISWAPYRVYESYAWLHMHLGRDGCFNDPKWYYCVIPNAFDTSLFEFKEKRGEDFLYLGRLNDDKGVRIAVDCAKHAGRRIILAGQGDARRFLEPHVKALPPVGIEARKVLLREARAVFCPSHYVEPFCGVSIEAALSGAPVISTDWGAFAENVIHGVTGYRCRTMDDFVWAAKNVERINPRDCRDWALSNFSLERVAGMYQGYFFRVLESKPGLPGWNRCVGVAPPDISRKYPQAACDGPPILADVSEAAQK